MDREVKDALRRAETALRKLERVLSERARARGHLGDRVAADEFQLAADEAANAAVRLRERTWGLM